MKKMTAGQFRKAIAIGQTSFKNVRIRGDLAFVNINMVALYFEKVVIDGCLYCQDVHITGECRVVRSRSKKVHGGIMCAGSWALYGPYSILINHTGPCILTAAVFAEAFTRSP